MRADRDDAEYLELATRYGACIPLAFEGEGVLVASRWVLTSLPLFLLVVITLINPSYMHILYSSTGGKVLLVLSAISVTAGSFVIKRIVNIKV